MKLATRSVDHAYLGIQEKIIISFVVARLGFTAVHAWLAYSHLLAAIPYEMTPCSNSITCDLRFSKFGI